MYKIKIKGFALIECICSLAIFSLICISFLLIFKNILFLEEESNKNINLIYYLHGAMEKNKCLNNEDIKEELSEVTIDQNIYYIETKKELYGNLNKIIISVKKKNDSTGEANKNEKKVEFSIYK